MQARYTREIVADRHCLFLTVNGVRHLVSTSRVVDCATFGASVAPVAPVAPPVAPRYAGMEWLGASVAPSVNIPDVAPPVAPTRPKRVRHTLFNLRRSVAAARRRAERRPVPMRCESPIGLTPRVDSWNSLRQRARCAPAVAPLAPARGRRANIPDVARL